jgi:hypothetical protein
MNKYTDELKLKLAWQAAYELRTCPPDEILLTDPIDENLRQHLAICHLCRDRRALSTDELRTWEALKNKFADNVVRPATGTTRQPGQIWTLSNKAGGWADDGRYLQPPAVLLLAEGEHPDRWLVSQLHHDKRLMGQGDIALDDRFGFAQGWNCYQVVDQLLEGMIGCVTQEQLRMVFSVSESVPTESAADFSVLGFFQKMERGVGSYIQGLCPAIPKPVTKPDVQENETLLEQLFGSVAAVYKKLAGYNVPEYAETLFDLLTGTSNPNAILPVTAATSISLQINIFSKQLDGSIIIKTVAASLTDSNWEDGDYYVAGKLSEIQLENLFLVASLSLNGKVLSECQSHIEKGSPYFDIVFEGLKKDVCSIDNLKLILVKP